MANYCSNCGQPIQDGAMCSCTTPKQPNAEQPPVMHQSPSQESQQPPQDYQQPVPSPTGEAAKKVYVDVKNVVSNFTKDPLNTAAGASSINTATATSLFAVEAFSIAFFLWVIVIKVFAAFAGSYAKAPDIPLDAIIKIIFIAALEIGLMFACLVGMAKALGSKMLPMKFYTSTAVSSIPCTAGILASALILLIFGIGEISGYLVIILFITAIVFSISLLGRSIYDNALKGSSNLIVISVAYSVHFVAFVYIASKIMGDWTRVLPIF